MTIALLFALARGIAGADQSLKAGRWEPAAFIGAGWRARRWALSGWAASAARWHGALALGMRVIVNQTRATSELAEEWRVEQVGLRDLLTRADFVSLHVPMRAANRNLIGAAELALMKPGAFLINTARGGLVDECALLAALESGRLAGAALDVFADEPQPAAALVCHPRVIATPHIAGSTEDARRAAALAAAEQILAVLQRKRRAEALGLRPGAHGRRLPARALSPGAGRASEEATHAGWAAGQPAHRGRTG